MAELSGCSGSTKLLSLPTYTLLQPRGLIYSDRGPRLSSVHLSISPLLLTRLPHAPPPRTHTYIYTHSLELPCIHTVRYVHIRQPARQAASVDGNTHTASRRHHKHLTFPFTGTEPFRLPGVYGVDSLNLNVFFFLSCISAFGI